MFPRVEMLLPGTAKISINLKIWLSSGHFGFLMLINYQAKEVTIVSGIVNCLL